MKLLSLLLFWTCMHVSAATFSQTITLNVKKQPLPRILASIEQQTGYHILYNDRYINPRKLVSIQADNRPLEEVLNKLLTPQALTYFIKDKTIAIRTLDTKQSPYGKEEEFSLQQQTISGRVTDEKGEPLEGVTVAAKGTSAITSTDAEGTFQLTVEGTNRLLVFSAVGFETQELPLSGQNKVNVTLEAEDKLLEEAVVIGYGTAKRKDITGSIASIAADQLMETPAVSLNQAMQGKIAGVQVNLGDNAPGGGVSVLIRGQGSINQGNDPIYVVDGIIMQGH